MREIESACGIRFTGLVNNSNLGEETTAEDVLASLPYGEAVSAATGLPVVMTGDFNYNMSSSHYDVLMSTTLGDTKKLSLKSEGGGSFNKFIGEHYASEPIDQIVATKDGFIFHEYKVLYDTVDGCFLSDHYAVIADMEIK